MQFKNLKDLFKIFHSEEVCREYLIQQRWNGKPVCPHCGYTEKAYVIEGGKRFKCGNKECHKKYSVTVGTVFENSNVALTTWFAALYLCTSSKKGISSLQLSRQLGITQKTAWFLLHRVREMLKAKAPYMLKNMVQIDETFIGGKNKNRHADKKVPESQGRSVKDKTPVLGAIEQGGKVTTRVIPNTQAKTLKPIIENLVLKGAIMVTDEWPAYNVLKANYNHVVINHSQGEYVRGAFHTNNIEGFWSLLKRGIYGIYHQVSPTHLQRYCDEFEYRYNSRKILDHERFELSVKNIGGRLKYRDLIKKVK